MKLKKINFKNYKQFIDSTINFEDEITVLAGANNSGKTSLIELLKNVFTMETCELCIDDIPIKALRKWIDEVVDKIIDIFNKGLEKKDILKEVYELLTLIDAIEQEEQIKYSDIEGIILEIQVDYEEDEDISKFTDYLMDLDDNVKSFYFLFEYSANKNKLMKILDESYTLLKNQINKLAKKDEEAKEQDDSEKNILKENLMELYIKSFESKYYFTDSTYTNKIAMDKNVFKKLFNFYYIDANRMLTDENINKKHSISNEMINYISKDAEWEELIKDLPTNLKDTIENTKIKSEIKSKSLQALQDVICEIKKTNGGRATDILLDFNIDDNSIKNFIKSITNAKYVIEEFYLKETAQGLGYSNLIFIHLKLENYLKTIDSTVVNVFIIEEPEAHMHPQMQKVFIEYLFRYYEDKNIQGMITTHSNEIIKAVKMKKIRVIREKEAFVNQIHDMNYFLNSIDKIDVELKKFYSLFFNINFSEIIFADRVIMYEGDTERMYIQKLLKEPRFKDIDKLYIAYVQVGGAHAHLYKEIIKYLGIKTLIFTDIDYNKELNNIAKILESNSTNATIKNFYGESNEESSLLVKDIYEWVNIDELICLKFQRQEDGYARTLEEAMISKLISKNCEDKLSKEEWEKIRKEYKLKFTIPQGDEKCFIRDIVNATSNKKTDFMYSVIQENLVLDMIPNYMEEGLKWLVE